MEFKELGLDEKLLKAIDELGFKEPSEIQEKSIPLLLDSDIDFVGQAQTGTGKTAAFVLPLLQKLDPRSKDVQALILTPTRELANQVEAEIKKFGKHTKLKSIAIFGGTSYDRQKQSLRKNRPQIIVGTPGRVMDLMNQKVINFKKSNYFILDEADEMLNMGFFDDVKYVLERFNEVRNMWMFSATMPKPILDLIKNDFKNPEIVKTKKKTISNDDIEQNYYLVNQRNHHEALCRLIDANPDMYGIVFCRTKADCRTLSDHLIDRSYSVETLHGDMGQKERDQSMARFKSQRVQLLVCTDVAARGIDVNNLSHVINMGPPQDHESYVHRIGRTGRAGMKGQALSIIDPRDIGKFKRVEKFIKKEIALKKLPKVDEVKGEIVRKEIDSMAPLVNTILEKGNAFKMDETFDYFKECFADIDREEILKILFSLKFNKRLRRYNDLGDIDAETRKRGDKRERGGRKERSPRKDGAPRGPRAARAGNVRLFLNMGKDNGLRLRDLLKDLSKQTGVRENQIQNVDLKGKFSFLEVPKKDEKRVLAIKGLKIKNKNVRLEVSN